MSTEFYEFGARIARQTSPHLIKQAKGGVFAQLGDAAARGVRNISKMPTPSPAGAMTVPKIPPRVKRPPVTPGTNTGMGATVLSHRRGQVGQPITGHKQYGDGVIKSVNNNIATAEFANGVTRQYRVAPAPAPVKPRPAATARPRPAAPAAPPTPPRTPSMPDRVFSAARRYGNVTGVAPTSLGGIAAAAINPHLQDASMFADNAFGTNFSGQDANRTDWSTRVGQVAFPTRKAYKYVGGKLQEHGPSILEQVRQFIPDTPQ
jgi:hypothetical protein